MLCHDRSSVLLLSCEQGHELPYESRDDNVASLPKKLACQLHVAVLLFVQNACKLFVIRQNDRRERHLSRFTHPRETYTLDQCLASVQEPLSVTSNLSVLKPRVTARVMTDHFNPRSSIYIQEVVPTNFRCAWDKREWAVPMATASRLGVDDVLI